MTAARIAGCSNFAGADSGRLAEHRGMRHQDNESLNAVENLLKINVVSRRMVMISAQSAAKGINNVSLIHCLSTPMSAGLNIELSSTQRD